jgi:hypothetical protein
LNPVFSKTFTQRSKGAEGARCLIQGILIYDVVFDAEVPLIVDDPLDDGHYRQL